MAKRDRWLWLLLLLAFSKRGGAGARNPRNSGIPEGPPTEDNWIPPQPVLPPNPLDKGSR